MSALKRLQTGAAWLEMLQGDVADDDYDYDADYDYDDDGPGGGGVWQPTRRHAFLPRAVVLKGAAASAAAAAAAATTTTTTTTTGVHVISDDHVHANADANADADDDCSLSCDDVSQTSTDATGDVAAASRECRLCADELVDDPTSDEHGVRVSACGHRYCRECLVQYVKFASTDADVLRLFTRTTLRAEPSTIECPPPVKGARASSLPPTSLPSMPPVYRLADEQAFGLPCCVKACTALISVEDVRRFVDASLVERLQHLHRVRRERDVERRAAHAEQQQLRDAAADPARRRCPSCASVHLRFVRRGRLQCVDCTSPLCLRCGRDHKYNGGDFCSDDSLRERRRAARVAAMPVVANGAASRLPGTNGRVIVVPCPKCLRFTVRESGCHFLYCRCGQTFCELCGAGLNSAGHIAHYTGHGGPFNGHGCAGVNDSAHVTLRPALTSPAMALLAKLSAKGGK